MSIYGGLMKFKAKLEQSGKTATGFEVPARVVEALGSSRKPAVRITLNGGYTYRSTVAFMGGRYLLGVSAEVRAAAGVAAGDRLEVALALDTEPRTVVVPDDLKVALAKDGAAQRAFAALNYSNQRRYVDGLNTAKTEETRQRRIAKIVAELHSAKQ
jgi:hypothetical protein